MTLNHQKGKTCASLSLKETVSQHIYVFIFLFLKDLFGVVEIANMVLLPLIFPRFFLLASSR